LQSKANIKLKLIDIAEISYTYKFDTMSWA